MRKPISHEAHFKRQKRVLLFLLVVVHPLDNHVDNLEKSVKVVVIVKNKLHGIYGGRVDVLPDIERVNMIKKNTLVRRRSISLIFACTTMQVRGKVNLRLNYTSTQFFFSNKLLFNYIYTVKLISN